METKEILAEGLGKEKRVTLYKDFSVAPLPKVIRIEPAGLCNLKCRHCPNKDAEASTKGVMSMDTFDNIIEQLKTLPALPVLVLYHGGEPMLNRNFPHMVKTLRALGGKFIKTVTNGMLLNDEKIEQIIESGIDSVEFSLDGRSPEENNYIRTGGKFDLVIANIKKLIAKKKELGSETPSIFISNCQVPTREEVRKKPEPEVPQFLIDEFKGMENEIDFKTTYMLMWTGLDLGDRYEIMENEGDEKEPSNYCEHVTEMMSIRWNGEVVPCCYDITSEYVIGNINTTSLKDIWNNERYRAIRRSIHERRFLRCARTVM
jgi:MoaA/NifB/PqqE/SkfB family radical SAM enzyme